MQESQFTEEGGNRGGHAKSPILMKKGKEKNSRPLSAKGVPGYERGERGRNRLEVSRGEGRRGVPLNPARARGKDAGEGTGGAEEKRAESPRREKGNLLRKKRREGGG